MKENKLKGYLNNDFIKKENGMITSSSNAQIKSIVALAKKKKERDEQKVFVVEGRRMFDEIKKEGTEALKVYVSDRFLEGADKGYLDGFDYEQVDEKVFKDISETVTPQGILAIVRQPEYDLQKLLQGIKAKGKGRILILEDIQDPGNLGTMFRTAEAAGMDMVVMTKGTADLFSPKVIRSTMGSALRVPFVYTDDLSGTVSLLKSYGIKVFGTTLPSSVDFRSVDYTGLCAVVIGNEGNGMSDSAVALCDKCVHIPMEGRVESLNAAVAAALIMFETNRVMQ